MAVFEYKDEVLETIGEAGWILSENATENGHLVYTRPDRDEYRLTFANWEVPNECDLQDCDITIDETNVPRAVYFYMKPAFEARPVEVLKEELGVFAQHYL